MHAGSHTHKHLLGDRDPGTGGPEARSRAERVSWWWLAWLQNRRSRVWPPDWGHADGAVGGGEES